MIILKRTHSDDTDFQQLINMLDEELAVRDGEEHAFFAQFNKTGNMKYVVVAYESGVAAGCGAIKPYDDGIMEIKRMFVLPASRSKGIASIILKELEAWATELHTIKCILETGYVQPEAIRLYTKNGYVVIPNYGQYVNIKSSICFEKELVKV